MRERNQHSEAVRLSEEHGPYREYRVVLKGESYVTTVLIGKYGHAFCTCRTFGFIDFGQRFRYAIEYEGSTGIHGCQHVDYVAGRHMWNEQLSRLTHLTATEVMLEEENRRAKNLYLVGRGVEQRLVDLEKEVTVIRREAAEARMYAGDANRLASRAANHHHLSGKLVTD